MKKLFPSQYIFLPVLAILATAIFWGIESYPRFDSAGNGFYECNDQMMSKQDLLTYRNITEETMQKVQAGRGLTYEELCNIPQDKLDRAIFRSTTPKPDHPGEAIEFRRMQLENEFGEIPENAYNDALARIDQMAASQEIGATSAGIENNTWDWIGPGNIGGRVRAIAIHPTTPDIMWAGSVSGGIWKTANGGASWQAQDDFMANLSVTSIVIHPNNPDTLYAATGEGFFNGDALRGDWIFKTTDGGATWSPLARGVAEPETYVGYVNRLAISPDGNTLLAATEYSILRSNINTDDEVWTNQFWPYDFSYGSVLDINFNPSDSLKAIASGDGYSIYSTDRGVTWNFANFTGADTSNFGRIEIAYAPSNPNIVYASIDNHANDSEIWKSTDGGKNYSRQSTGNTYLGSQGWYGNVIWVDPTNANTLVVGGIDLWRSTDGGVNLSKISTWWASPDSAHADHHMIIEHPDFNGTTNKTVYFGNDGGVYRADDIYTVEGTTGWTELNNNLGITQFYGAAGNPTTGEIIGGTQDNGTLFYQNFYGNDYGAGSEDWATTFGGDGGFSAADPNNVNCFYGEYINLRIHRSSDRGASAEYIDGEYLYWNAATSTSEWRWKSAPYRIDDAMMNSHANFIAPFILDPNNSNSMLAGGLSLWRTINVKAALTDTTGPAWYAIKPSVGSNISAIAVAPGNSNLIWVGHNNGNVYKTTNGGTNWTQVDTKGSNILPDRYVSRIAIDQNNNNIAYVTFTGFSADNIYKTTDGGSNWNDISGSLPSLPIRSVVINPLNSNFLYLGTELGVFTSENAGTSWDTVQDGPANVSVDELFFLDDTTLVAATHGRGLFTASVDINVTNPNPDPPHDDINNPVVIPADLGGSSNYRYPATGYTDTTTATRAGEDPAIPECNLSPGNASVWYEYNPTADTALVLDTLGSSYDTYIAVWKKTGGELELVACHDNVSNDVKQSQLAMQFQSNVSYLIEIAQWSGALDDSQ